MWFKVQLDATWAPLGCMLLLCSAGDPVSLRVPTDNFLHDFTPLRLLVLRTRPRSRWAHANRPHPARTPQSSKQCQKPSKVPLPFTLNPARTHCAETNQCCSAPPNPGTFCHPQPRENRSFTEWRASQWQTRARVVFLLAVRLPAGKTVPMLKAVYLVLRLQGLLRTSIAIEFPDVPLRPGVRTESRRARALVNPNPSVFSNPISDKASISSGRGWQNLELLP
jgi:hypothetical protein